MNEFNYSVIIPAHNAERTIIKAISSALSQTIPPSEIVVVCDSNTDATEKLINDTFPERVKVFNVNFESSAKSRNFGVHNMDSEYIAFLDADDFWALDKIERQTPHLSSSQMRVISATDSLYINMYGTVIGRNVRTANDDEANKMLKDGSGMPSLLSTWLMPADLFIGLDGFDTDLPMSEDFDFACRAVKSGVYFKVVREPLTSYLLHGGSKTAKKKLLQNTVARGVRSQSQTKDTREIEDLLPIRNSATEYRDAYVDIHIRKFLISARPSKLKRNYLRLLIAFTLNPKRVISKFFSQRL